MQDLVCVMSSLLSVLCAVFSLWYVKPLVCVMCSFSHEPRRFTPSMPRFARQRKAPQGPKRRALAGPKGMSQQVPKGTNLGAPPQPPSTANEILSYMYVYLCVNIYSLCIWQRPIDLRQG